MWGNATREATGGSALTPAGRGGMIEREAERHGEGDRESRALAVPELPEVITNIIGMKLRLIQPGTFTMGDEFVGPPHEITITGPFYLGVYAVTQAEYEPVVGLNPSHFRGPDRPVEQVSWDDAWAFCRKLSETEGVEYRLPTEAEWEYACRAGSTAEHCFGDDEARLAEHGWYDDNSESETHDVGQKKPNAWGLFDMHGNVDEWCQSLYEPYPYGTDDGREELSADGMRVLRGGSWAGCALDCRCADRSCLPPAYSGDNVGFRVARSLP